MPNSVTEIGQRAFENGSSLASVTIPDSVTRMDKSVFAGCSFSLVDESNQESEESVFDFDLFD